MKDNIVLIGSDRWPSMIKVNGVEKQLGYFVAKAFDDSAVNWQTWNSPMFEDSRELWIERVIKNEKSVEDIIADAQSLLTRFVEAYPVHGSPQASLDKVIDCINVAKRKLHNL